MNRSLWSMPCAFGCLRFCSTSRNVACRTATLGRRSREHSAAPACSVYADVLLERKRSRFAGSRWSHAHAHAHADSDLASQALTWGPRPRPYDRPPPSLPRRDRPSSRPSMRGRRAAAGRTVHVPEPPSAVEQFLLHLEQGARTTSSSVAHKPQPQSRCALESTISPCTHKLC